MDWSSDPESLDQELRTLAPEAEVGKRIADKVMKVTNKAGDSRKDPETRAEEKVRLLLNLLQRGLDREEVQRWHKFLDWMLDLPPELEKRVLGRIEQYEEEKHVPFITSVERIGYERGRDEALAAVREGLLLLARMKFGTVDAAFEQLVQQQTDVERLRRAQQAVPSSPDLQAVRDLLTAETPPQP